MARPVLAQLVNSRPWIIPDLTEHSYLNPFHSYLDSNIRLGINQGEKFKIIIFLMYKKFIGLKNEVCSDMGAGKSLIFIKY